MARKKKSFKVELEALKKKRSLHMGKVDECDAAIKELWDKNTKSWFDELNDILKKGIEEETIDIEIATPAEIFNFCVNLTKGNIDKVDKDDKGSPANTDVKDETTAEKSDAKDEIKEKNKSDNKAQQDTSDKKEDPSQQDGDQQQEGDWGPVVYMS